MAKIVETIVGSGVWHFRCPACKSIHAVHTKSNNFKGAIWSLSGDANNPTFIPSIHLMWRSGSMHDSPPQVCHSIVKNGKIQYLKDSTHHLAGRIIDMEEFK